MVKFKRKKVSKTWVIFVGDKTYFSPSSKTELKECLRDKEEWERLSHLLQLTHTHTHTHTRSNFLINNFEYFAKLLRCNEHTHEMFLNTVTYIDDCFKTICLQWYQVVVCYVMNNLWLFMECYCSHSLARSKIRKFRIRIHNYMAKNKTRLKQQQQWQHHLYAKTNR